MIRKSDGLLIGDCELEQMTAKGHSVAELGYDFRSDARCQGFATEAAAVRDHALEALGLPQLISLIRVGNAVSRRVAEKIGMQRVAECERFGHCYWRYALEQSMSQA